jgi:large subunit ribosomal protein L44e
MNMPKQIKRYCPYCRKHTDHKVTINKRKQGSSLSQGSKYRARKRGLARGAGNLGRYSKPAIGNFKMTGSKQSKKNDIRFECSVCHKKHVKKNTIRSKKLELK